MCGLHGLVREACNLALYLTTSLRTCRTLPVESQLCLFGCLESLGITLQRES